MRRGFVQPTSGFGKAIIVDTEWHYSLKTTYHDATNHVIFEPLDFIARLVALIPRPRVSITRFYGTSMPNDKHLVSR